MRCCCVVPGCSSSSTRNRELRFFKFPTRPLTFNKWKEYMDMIWKGERPYQHKGHHRICEKHFHCGKATNKIPTIFLTDTGSSDTCDTDNSNGIRSNAIRIKTEVLDSSENWDTGDCVKSEVMDQSINANTGICILPEVIYPSENWDSSTSYETAITEPGTNSNSGICVKREVIETSETSCFGFRVKTEITDSSDTCDARFGAKTQLTDTSENWNTNEDDSLSKDVTHENSELQYLRNLMIAKDALINQLAKDISRYKRLVNDLVKNNHKLKSEVDYLQQNNPLNE